MPINYNKISCTDFNGIGNKTALLTKINRGEAMDRTGAVKSEKNEYNQKRSLQKQDLTIYKENY